jgi:hypothetical protein
MPSWSDFADAAPEAAATVRARLDAYPYKLLATLRKDGSPRASGIEVEFLDDGEMRAASMHDSVKARGKRWRAEPSRGSVSSVERQCVYLTSSSRSDPPETSIASTAWPLPLA